MPLFRYFANCNSRFFEILTNISFFVFSLNFGVLFIVPPYIETTQVRLYKKCLFVFIALHKKTKKIKQRLRWAGQNAKISSYYVIQEKKGWGKSFKLNKTVFIIISNCYKEKK